MNRALEQNEIPNLAKECFKETLLPCYRTAGIELGLGIVRSLHGEVIVRIAKYYGTG